MVKKTKNKLFVRLILIISLIFIWVLFTTRYIVIKELKLLLSGVLQVINGIL